MMNRNWLDDEYEGTTTMTDDERRAFINYHCRVRYRPEPSRDHFRQFKKAVIDWLTHTPTDRLRPIPNEWNWATFRRAWITTLESKLQIYKSFQQPGPATQEDAWGHRADVRELSRLLQRVRRAAPPPAVTAAAGPRDGDGWQDAVVAQGTKLPHGGDYYVSTHWQVLNESRTGRCAQCHRVGTTQLHHITDDRFGCERPEDLIELCVPCHACEHRGGIWKKAA